MGLLDRFRRKHPAPPPEDPKEAAAFRAWFEVASASAVSHSFGTVREADLLPALYVLLIRAAAGPTEGADGLDDHAVQVYEFLRDRAADPGEAIRIAYRVALCASVDDMRTRHRELTRIIQPPATNQ